MVRLSKDGATASPKASRVGIKATRFDLTRVKTARVRRLRRDSTDVEMRRRQKLRNRQLGIDFRRQHAVGDYVLDFYAPALRLVIELDGGQHLLPRTAARDDHRMLWLADRGVIVLRFWNSDVIQNLSGLLEVIAAKIAEMRTSGMIPTRPPSLRWRSASAADLPFSRGGKESRGHT